MKPSNYLVHCPYNTIVLKVRLRLEEPFTKITIVEKVVDKEPLHDSCSLSTMI